MIDLSNWKILVVEDEVDAQDMIAMILRQHGTTLTIVPTAEDALEFLQQERPTVVISDLSLPSMDGWQLLKSVQSNPALSGIPVVAITAYHSIRVAQEAIAAGFVAYFPKPIGVRTFVEDLVNAVEGIQN